MSEPNMPALEDLGERHFSFYPAILNIEHNEWRLKRVAWSEILVVNTKTGEELWIPRRLVGEIVQRRSPHPHHRAAQGIGVRGRRGVASRAAHSLHAEGRRALTVLGDGGPGPFIAFAGWATPGAEGKIGRLIGIVLLAGVAIVVAVVAITQRPVSYKGMEQLALQLNAERRRTTRSSASSASRRRIIGVPAPARSLSIKRCDTRDRPYTLVLMGVDRNSVRYIGALDKDWKPVHSVRLPSGGDTLAMLRSVPKF